VILRHRYLTVCLSFVVFNWIMPGTSEAHSASQHQHRTSVNDEQTGVASFYGVT